MREIGPSCVLTGNGLPVNCHQIGGDREHGILIFTEVARSSDDYKKKERITNYNACFRGSREENELANLRQLWSTSARV